MKRTASSAPPKIAAELRRRAEARLGERRKSPPATAKDGRTLHELEVHQIELELQNAELERARNDLEMTLEKYTDLYDFAPVGYFSLDPTGLILEANLMGAALLGVERSRLINGRLRRFVAPAGQPAFLAFFERVLAGTGKQVCEAELRKADGTTFWASFHGTPALALSGPEKWCRVAVSDITSRKLAEELLRRNEVLFSTLVQQAPVGVYVVDRELRLQEVNARAEPVFRNVQPLFGHDLPAIMRTLWPAKIAAEIVARFRQTLQTGQPFYSPDFTLRRRDSGATESYEWQLQRLTLPDGEHGVVCFFTDITARKHAEATQRRIAVLAASNQKLEQEIAHRRTVEATLQKSERHQRRLLEEAHRMHRQLRQLSHQILRAQEEERKRISRELHDEIAQTLAGINIRLATLPSANQVSARELKRRIAETQRLVAKSVTILHRFARDLRPTLLDDLGLIPALQSFVKQFAKESRLRVRLTAPATVDALNNNQRTVLYRVAQEALTNVSRHAQASRVAVTVGQQARAVTLTVKDNGKSFPVTSTLNASRNKRLGLLGMRERVEMVGGTLRIESATGRGTTIHVEIPYPTRRGGGAMKQPAKPNLGPP